MRFCYLVEKEKILCREAAEDTGKYVIHKHHMALHYYKSVIEVDKREVLALLHIAQGIEHIEECLG